MKPTFHKFWRSLGDVLFPRTCEICGTRLGVGEEHICAACLLDLPLTEETGAKGNAVERIFWGDFEPVRAAAYMHYRPGSDSALLIKRLKYHGRRALGPFLGRMAAASLERTGFFDGVDCIVPLPLSRQRQRSRGYNQSEEIAKGIAQISGLPIEKKAAKRIVDNPSQTGFNFEERRANVQGIFRISKPERLRGKHVLIVDDIITTGSTLTELAKALLAVDGVSVSILAIGLAGTHREGVDWEKLRQKKWNRAAHNEV